SLICYSPDICIPKNDYFNDSTISSATVLPISSDERIKVEAYPNKSGDAVSTRSDREKLSRESDDIKPDDSGN
ncbi:300_t:CDS:1, partial [Gigaspora margarita]